jgi:hypothetical protein
MSEPLPGAQDVRQALMDMPQVSAAVFFDGRDISGARMGKKPGVLLLGEAPPDAGTQMDHIGTKVISVGFAALFMQLDKCPTDLYYDILCTGQIVLDRDGRLMEAVHRAEEKKDWAFGWRIFAEFTYLMEKFNLSRTFYLEGKKLDSYRNLVESLLNWARIAMYQQGAIPRRDIWAQVKEHDLGIDRLYEELIYSEESLDKRIELMQLVYQNQVYSQAKALSAPLLNLLAKQGAMGAAKLKSMLPQGIQNVYLESALAALTQLGHIQKDCEDGKDPVYSAGMS